MIESNLKQAEVPDVCKVIVNKRGTAPGMWFEKDGKIFVSMPGVPHEMKGMMEDEVIDSLKKRFILPHIAYRTLLTAGIGESYLAELIKDFETALPENIKLAYLPNYGMVRLRLSTSGINTGIVEKDVQRQFEKLQSLVKDYLVTNEDESIESVVGKLLKAKGRTVSTAESCTGGYIAHLFTAMPGSSAFYEGSIVSYSNDVKESVLQVEQVTLQTFGAVSEEVVKQMLQGALQKIKTNYAIAVSGIMGPDGGTEDKPVGTVWIAVGNEHKIVTKKLYFRFDRMRNIQLTAVNALNMLRQFIIEN
jgi:nicotinamide-nucleotide amidase